MQFFLFIHYVKYFHIKENNQEIIMRTIFVFIFFIIISFTGYGQEELTLDDAIQIALT